jgi:hypothetical protein
MKALLIYDVKVGKTMTQNHCCSVLARSFTGFSSSVKLALNTKSTVVIF